MNSSTASEQVAATPAPEIWRGAFTIEEQKRFLFLREHDYERGFYLVGLRTEYIAEWRALQAKLNRFCRDLITVEDSRYSDPDIASAAPA